MNLYVFVFTLLSFYVVRGRCLRTSLDEKGVGTISVELKRGPRYHSITKTKTRPLRLWKGTFKGPNPIHTRVEELGTS